MGAELFLEATEREGGQMERDDVAISELWQFCENAKKRVTAASTELTVLRGTVTAQV